MSCPVVRQVTFQASDIDESRFLYDQLAVLAPIMMALTAATPIVKGRLAATDVRWSCPAGDALGHGRRVRTTLRNMGGEWGVRNYLSSLAEKGKISGVVRV